MRIKVWVRAGAATLVAAGLLVVGGASVGTGTVPVCVTEDQAGVCMWEGTVRSWDPDKVWTPGVLVTGTVTDECETVVEEDGYVYCDG